MMDNRSGELVARKSLCRQSPARPRHSGLSARAHAAASSASPPALGQPSLPLTHSLLRPSEAPALRSRPLPSLAFSRCRCLLSSELDWSVSLLPPESSPLSLFLAEPTAEQLGRSEQASCLLFLACRRRDCSPPSVTEFFRAFHATAAAGWMTTGVSSSAQPELQGHLCRGRDLSAHARRALNLLCGAKQDHKRGALLAAGY